MKCVRQAFPFIICSFLAAGAVFVYMTQDKPKESTQAGQTAQDPNNPFPVISHIKTVDNINQKQGPKTEPCPPPINRRISLNNGKISTCDIQ